MKYVYPALMTLEQVVALKQFTKPVDRVHVDVMDGIFVSSKTDRLKAIVEELSRASYYCWFHLMMENPEPFFSLEHLPEQGMVSFHIEANCDSYSIIKSIKEKKYGVGIALNPKTRVEEIISFLPLIDQILVMSVEPGRSGQHFLSVVMEKIMFLTSYRHQHALAFRIGVDGGVTLRNVPELFSLGVDDFAVGNGIFGNHNSQEAYWLLHNLVQSGY